MKSRIRDLKKTRSRGNRTLGSEENEEEKDNGRAKWGNRRPTLLFQAQSLSVAKARRWDRNGEKEGMEEGKGKWEYLYGKE